MCAATSAAVSEGRLPANSWSAGAERRFGMTRIIAARERPAIGSDTRLRLPDTVASATVASDGATRITLLRRTRARA